MENKLPGVEINVMVRSTERCFAHIFLNTRGANYSLLADALHEPNSTTVGPSDIRWRQDTFDTKVSK
mgnify:FL=1